MDTLQLIRKIVKHFNVNELKSLCLELRVDYEELAGEEKEAKVRELVGFLERRERLPELLEIYQKLRPESSSQTRYAAFNAPKIPLLFLSADPTNASRLRLGEELREIQEKLQLAKLREQFTLEQRMSVRPVDLSQALLDVQPRIVHISGHGLATGALCFEDQLGNVHPLQPDALAALFEQFAGQVSCVILNACYSEAQANAIAHHIDFVIGMNKAIGDKAAIAFSIGFYQALGAGRTIKEAYKLGCVQIRLQSIPEHLTPVLISKKQLHS